MSGLEHPVHTERVCINYLKIQAITYFHDVYINTVVYRKSTIIYISNEAAIRKSCLAALVANFDKQSAIVCSLDWTIDFHYCWSHSSTDGTSQTHLYLSTLSNRKKIVYYMLLLLKGTTWSAILQETYIKFKITLF